MNNNLKGINKFRFFDIEEPEKLNNQKTLQYSLNDMVPISFKVYEKYYYVAGKLKNDNNPFKIVKIHPSGKIIEEYIPFTDSIIDFDIVKSEDKLYFIVIGTDLRNKDDKSKATAEIKENDQINKIIVNPSPDSIPSIKIFELYYPQIEEERGEAEKTDEEKYQEAGILQQNNIIYLMYKKNNPSDFYKNDNLEGLSEAYVPLLDISFFSVSPLMNGVAFSFKEYLVEIKLDSYNKKEKNKIFFTNSPDKKIITNIKYYTYNHECLLYLTTSNNMYYKIYGDTKFNLINNSGANPQNFDVNSRKSILISTFESNLIEEYDYNYGTKTYEKLTPKAFGLQIKFIQFFKNYYVFILYENNIPILCIYDHLNNIFAKFDESYKQKDIFFIVSTDDRIHILFGELKTKSIISLKECEDRKKFDIFYKNNFFDLAYDYGKNLKYDKEQLAEIAKTHAEYLYEKGDFEKSIEQYILTINYIYPTYVIQKFLDDSKKNYLIKYLEELQINDEFKGKCEKKRFNDFTTLLFNCYIKQKQIDKLKNFFEKQDIKDEVTIRSAISLCQEINNIELVISFSEKVKSEKMNDLYIQILINIPKEYKDYLKYTKIIPVFINQIEDIKNKYKILINYGKQLLEKKEIANDVYNSIIKLVSDIINIKKENANDQRLTNLKYDQIISIFSIEENADKLDQLLEKIINEDKDCPNQIITKGIELYLEIYNKKGKDSGKEYANKIVNLIKKYEKKIDKNYLLMLFKLSGFDEGVAELSKIMELDQDLLQLYMEKKDYKMINEACKESMRENKIKDKKVNYWLQALNFYLEISNKSNLNKINEYIVEVLDSLLKQEEFSPMNLIDILKKYVNDENRIIEIKEIKNFFKDWIKQKKDSLKEDQYETEENYKKIEQYDKNIKDFQKSAKSLKSTYCSSCRDSLDMPFIFFMCGHGYHQSCLADYNGHYECSFCKSKNSQMFNKIENGERIAKEPEKYNEDLDNETKGNKFDIFASYLGKGVFVQESQC